MLEPDNKTIEDNLTNGERNALASLMNNKDIIIKPADKGSSIVIMNVKYYHDKLVLSDHLHGKEYKRVQEDSDENVVRELSNMIKKHEACLTKKEIEYITKFEWKTSELYVLPKVHKCKSIIETIKSNVNKNVINLLDPPDLKGRPIVAGCTTPTRHISELIEKILKPIVTVQHSYIKDDWDFLKNLPNVINPSYQLFSCDIKSLYTSIPHDLGIKAIQYWLTKRRDLIDTRFTDNFILESILFILKNNNFLFDNVMWNQQVGTAMGHIFAPAYACLTIGYLEEDILFKTELSKVFDEFTVCEIKKNFKRYMDDGSTLLPPSIECETLLASLNNLHPAIEYTLEAAMRVTIDEEKEVQILNFLDITVILDNDGRIETDIYYKPTNSHKYLDYHSFHPTHCKNNIPYALAKRIIVFVTNTTKMEYRLDQLRCWLRKCNYPNNVIEKGIHNARLQGPGFPPKMKNDSIPFVSTLMSNYNADSMVNSIRTQISSVKSDHLREVLQDVKIVAGYKQPKNLKGLLTHAKFSTRTTIPKTIVTPGIFAECTTSRCKLCSSDYMQNCSSFETSNGFIWEIRSHINCNTEILAYYLKCNMCDGKVTYTGITKTKFRTRTNNHITCCRHGTGSNLFDNHVFECGTKNGCLKEPYFKVYAYMKFSTVEKLLTYERYLHRRGFDTINK